jgi:hypothetical protein
LVPVGNRPYLNDGRNAVTTGYPVDVRQARRRQQSLIRHEMILSDELFGFRPVSSHGISSKRRSMPSVYSRISSLFFSPGIIAAAAIAALSERHDQWRCRELT